MTDVKTMLDSVEPTVKQDAESADQFTIALDSLTKKTVKVLRLLCESGNPTTILASSINQRDLARKLYVTRQALSIHITRLADAGLIQAGRGFINVTESGLKATGYRYNPAILMVRVAPQHQREAYERIRGIRAFEIFRVAGDADFTLVVDQRDLDKVLQDLYAIPGIIETRSLIATETVRQTNITEYYLTALFTSFVHMLGKESMCEHCDAIRQVLTELTGEKVAAVIMRRTEARLHGSGREQFSNNFLVVTA